MMLLVVVGAGASYDSVPEPGFASGAYRPPLADHLFDNKPEYARHLSRYTYASAVASRARMAISPGHPLERFLESLRDEEGADPIRAKQLLAVKFYLRSLLAECAATWMQNSGGATNYAALADLIDSCRVSADQAVSYVSFNYDNLLEHGLATRGIEFGDLQSYISGKTRLFKVHGSVDWGQVVTCAGSFPPGVYPNTLCEIVERLTITAEYVKAAGNVFDYQTAPSRVLIPAIAIPTQTKRNFACPDEHIEALGSVLPQVGGLLAVGWRGAEEHFLKLLREGLPPATPAFVVSDTKEHGDETNGNLSRCGIGVGSPFVGGFTGAMADDAPGRHGQQLRQFVRAVLAKQAA
jgi:hypothetical protein